MTRGLFREHYLRRRLPADGAWQEEFADLQSRLGHQLERIRSSAPRMNEATLETEWIRPTLGEIGFGSDQLIEKQQADAFEPDYVLFRSGEDRDRALGRRQAGGPIYEQAIALVEAKAWNVDLDAAQGRERSPMSQIKRYLVESGVTWGILTNGCEWRLVSREGSADQYYGVDLPALTAASGEDFKYFAAIFSHTALTTGRLNQIRSESLRFAQELEDDLRSRVREALTPLGQGLLHGERLRRGHPGWRPDAEGVGVLFDAAMLVLYRSLFAAYAEARELLPLSSPAYRRYSLRHLLEDVAAQVGPTREPTDFATLAAGTSAFFGRARALWELIERGEGERGAPLYVPRYNGGLFRRDLPEGRPLSAAARLLGDAGFGIPDRWFAQVLDILARIERDGQLEPVDYAELRERQLGSIYEGLLELEFRIAEAPLAAVRSGGREIWTPANEVEAGADVVEQVAPGELYVSTDSNERRATGAFYTPDWVVEYIVSETVGPLFDDRSRAVGERLSAATAAVERSRRGSVARRAAEGHLDELRRSVRDQLLDLRVLDPAMGSGHFLVGVVDYLATRVATDPSYVPAEGSGDAELADLRRLVAERCVYGVDLSYLAVELTKLSLWLRTMVFGKPLDFLDHHLRWGNSLLGISDLAELSHPPAPTAARTAQLGFVDQMAAEQTARTAGNLRLMALLPSDSMADIEQKEQILESFQQDAARLRTLADFRMALDADRDVQRALQEQWPGAQAELKTQVDLFGAGPASTAAGRARGGIPTRFYTAVAHWLRNNPGQAFRQLDTLLAFPRDMGTLLHFFHWPIEFPDVWAPVDGTAPPGGFDAVIGNPPYVRMEGFREIKPFLRARYLTHESRADLYVYFVERAHQLLRKGGRCGMILSNKFLRANYGGSLLDYLSSRANVERVVDFGGSGIFAGATVRPAILTFGNEAPTERPLRYAEIRRLDFTDLVEEVAREEVRIARTQVSGSSWRLVGSEVQQFLDRMDEVSIPLAEAVPGGICWGIKSGLNAAFYISPAVRDTILRENPEAAEVIRPLVTGSEIRRYHLDSEGRYLLYMYHGVDIGRYPAVEQHLEPYRAALENRATRQEWYELQQPQMAYRDQFEGEKIGYPEMTAESRFALVPAGWYPNNKVFILPTGDPLLLALLSSAAMFSWLGHSVAKLESTPGAAPFLELRAQYLSQLPVRALSDPDTQSSREFSAMAFALEAGNPGGLWSLVTNALPLRADGTPDVVRERSACVGKLLGAMAAELSTKHTERQTLLRSVRDWIAFRGLHTGTASQAFLAGEWSECGSAAEVLERFRTYRARLTRAELTDIETELQEAFRRLVPLNNRILFLDGLVDRIVERLYGVEGLLPANGPA